MDDGIEAFEPVSHCDWSGGSFTFVAGPAAEASDGPGGPSEGSGWIGILLLGGAALQSRLQGVQDLDLSVVKNVDCRLIVIVGGAGEHQLHGLAGGDEGNDGELFEGIAVLNDALFNAQPLALDGSEQLFDVPALAIPTDHRHGLRDGLDVMKMGCG